MMTTMMMTYTARNETTDEQYNCRWNLMDYAYDMHERNFENAYNGR